MFTKTQIPKHTNCVRFGATRHADAYRLASIFLNGKGRLATAIDVIKARIKYGFKHPIWSCYITTASTEWFGLSREGKPFIVVLHNPGPLADEKILRENYISKRDDNHDFNVIPRQMFLDVFDGKYGKVEHVSLHDAVFDMNGITQRHDYLSKTLAEKHLLVQARLAGGNYETEKYIHVHLSGSVQENLENNKRKPGEIETAFLKCDCDAYFPSFLCLNKNEPSRENGHKMLMAIQNSPIDLEKGAIAHFITLGALTNMSGEMIVSEIDISKAGNDCAFLAILDKDEEIRLDKGVSMYYSSCMHDNLSQLFIPNEEKMEPHGWKYQIDKIKGWYFTQRFREKIPVGDKQKEWFVTSDPTFSVEGEQEFLVKSLKPLGRRTMKIPIETGYYTVDSILAQFSHHEANAFRVISGYKQRSKYYIGVVEYYKVEIYTDRIIPTETEILKNRKLLGRII